MTYFFKDKNTRPFAIATVVCAILLIICVVWFCFIEFGDRIYIKPMVVDEVDEVNDIVTLIDNSGNLWEFDGVEHWKVNDMVCVKMSDNSTTTIYDDIILKVWD